MIVSDQEGENAQLKDVEEGTAPEGEDEEIEEEFIEEEEGEGS